MHILVRGPPLGPQDSPWVLIAPIWSQGPLVPHESHGSPRRPHGSLWGPHGFPIESSMESMGPHDPMPHRVPWRRMAAHRELMRACGSHWMGPPWESMRGHGNPWGLHVEPQGPMVPHRDRRDRIRTHGCPQGCHGGPTRTPWANRTPCGPMGSPMSAFSTMRSPWVPHRVPMAVYCVFVCNSDFLIKQKRKPWRN